MMVIVFHSGYFLLWQDVQAPGLDGMARRVVVTILGNLNLGVPLFFVISGYCILASADGHRRSGRTSWHFLWRRFRRIYPPYWGSLLVFLGFSVGLPLIGRPELLGPPYPIALEVFRPNQISAAQWVGNLTLTETWRPLVGGGPMFVWTRVSWSLCYEEQFYFVTFLVLLVAKRHLYRAMLAVSVGSFLVRVVLNDIGALHRLGGTFPILWHEFAVGLAVYARLNVLGPSRGGRWVEAALLALAAFGLFFPPTDVPVRGSTLIAPLFGLLLIRSRQANDPTARDTRRRRIGARLGSPLVACGRRSYSLYLVHLPICTAGNVLLWELGVQSFWGRAVFAMPVVVLAAVGFGWLFHHLVERHFLPGAGGRRNEVV